MKVIVKPHNIQVISTPVNELEYNVTKVEFEFSEEITNDFVKEAYFTLDDKSYKQIIVNNKCDIPDEVLTKVSTIELGVVAYKVENNEEIIRYNPTPGYFTSWKGSLKQAENSEPITPSEMEQYEQALQDGLTEVNGKLSDINTAITETNNLNLDANKAGTTTTVTITKKDGTQKQVQILDGINGTNGIDGKDGKDGVDGKDGKDGTNGTNGIDGVSPIATVSKSNGTATITITDKNGTTTATVSDGVNGTNGTNGRDGYVQYTAGDNITIENNVISATGGDLSNYYTKNETQELIDDNGNAKIYTTKLALLIHGFYEGMTVSTTNTDNLNNMSDIITNGYKNGITGIYIGSGRDSSLYYMPMLSDISSKPNTLYFQGYIFPYENSNTAYHFIDCYVEVRGSWSGDVFTCSKITYSPNTQNSGKGYITTWRNDNAITPAGDYNPATKKYVDDSIASAITTTLGGSY